VSLFDRSPPPRDRTEPIRDRLIARSTDVMRIELIMIDGFSASS
jgi:hypothetical protein